MAAPVTAGQILADKYRVEKVLGEGGMGVVVAATDLQLERQVAIKFLLPEFTEHREAAQRFMREARAAVKIQSEHIARVIDVSTMPNGSPYMVMEYLQGYDLSQVIEKRGRVALEEATLFVIEASDAVAEAHSYGIVHRDLKPANLFLALQPDGSSRVKVLDFGISKSTTLANSGLDPSLTRTSSMMGSPLYMSPEQMKSTKDVDARTDIWALGVILYELLTGHLPFSAQSIPELSAKILLEEPTPIRNYCPDLPAELVAIIAHALQKEPAKRFSSVSELVSSLLPYAPRKARANAERIAKISAQAGLSTSSMNFASVPPPSSRQGSAIEPGAVRASTMAGFGNTRGPEIPTHNTGKWLLVGSLGALAVLGGLAVLFAGRGNAETSLAGAPSAELPTALAPAPASQAPLSAAVQEPAAQPAAPAAPPVSAAQEPPSSAAGSNTNENEAAAQGASSTNSPLTKPSTPVAATPPVAAKPPLVAKPRVIEPTVAKPRVPTAAEPKPVAPAPKPSSPDTAFKSKFGGRK